MQFVGVEPQPVLSTTVKDDAARGRAAGTVTVAPQEQGKDSPTAR